MKAQSVEINQGNIVKPVSRVSVETAAWIYVTRSTQGATGVPGQANRLPAEQTEIQVSTTSNPEEDTRARHNPQSSFMGFQGKS